MIPTPPARAILEAVSAMPRWMGFGVDAVFSRMARALASPAGPRRPAAVVRPAGKEQEPADRATPAAARPAADAACYGGSPESLSRDQQAVLDSAEVYLARGLDLKRWWEHAQATDCFAERFPLSTSYNRPDTSYGFFDVARVDGREMPIMGNFQSLLYDQPKSAGAGQGAARWMRAQVREFVLRYFMRISYFRQPEAFVPAADQQPAPRLLRPFSLCPEENPAYVGFGFSQFFFKRTDNAEIGAFPEALRYEMADLREIGPKFLWTLLHVDIFDFNFSWQPFGPGTPSLTLPLQEGSYLVMDRAFVVDEDDPAPGVLGRYGFGYSFIKNPQPSFIAYGPGEFDAAIELIYFTVYADGKVRVDAAFVANRPTRIAQVSLNPLVWAGEALNLASLGTARYLFAPLLDAAGGLPFADAAFDPVAASIGLINLLSGGLAAQTLCISMQQFEEIFLVKHFMQHYQALEGSVQTWRQIPDWLDSKNLPPWVVTGKSDA
jgi:hypothetical protein